jgi:hypothetical protein
MQIYFDESGDFKPVTLGTEKFCFILGVIVPETSMEHLKADFDLFVGKLSRNEFLAGEPKGSRLSLEHRRLLLEILEAHRNVLLVPISVNLGWNDVSYYSAAPLKIRSLIESNLHIDSTYMTTPKRAELAKRIGKLSAEALTRLISYFIAVLKGVEAIASRYYCKQFHSSYDSITVTFDRIGKAGGREELVLKDGIFGWIENWSHRMPLKRDTSVDESHPLFALYGDKKAGQLVFDLRKMLDGQIHFADSKLIWQIQLTDFLANTWSQTITDYDGRRGYRPLFRPFYRKSALPNNTPVGVVSLTDDPNSSVVAAPSYLNIFARMIEQDTKILPCD